MRKQFLIIITGLLVITSSIFAQKKDHPLIGHLEGAKLWLQNINNIHEYTVISTPLKNDTLGSNIKVTGKTTMTAYQYKGDNSAFGIIQNYTDYLKNNGFEIILSCKGGECGGNIAKYYTSLNKIETTDDNNLHAWQSRYFKNYLSAKKQENGKTIYVCIYIAQGWWDFPVYRIDVIEEKKRTNMITNDNITKEKSTQEVVVLQKDTETLATNNNKKSNSFSIQAGLSSYNFYDPNMYGEHVIYQSNGTYTGVLSGFKDLSGIYIKTSYFFNENIGIIADVAFHYGENGNYIENAASSITYKTSADLNFQRVGITGRFVGEKYPIKLSLSSGIGHGSFEAYYMIKTNNSSGESRVDYDGKVDFPMVYFQTELLIPIFKGLFFFSEYEYTVGWNEDFYMEHNTGSEYNAIEFKYPGLGGNNFRIGLGYEFWGK